MAAEKKPHLYKNILFASYGFSMICYFLMITVFESVMGAMQSGWVCDLLRINTGVVVIQRCIVTTS